MELFLLTLVPKGYALPLAAVLMVLVGLHTSMVRETVPPSARRRIRIANGYISLMAIPLLAIGFSVIDPDRHPATWVMVWLMAMALVAMIIGLAVLDIVNTARLSRKSRAKLRTTLQEAIAAAHNHRGENTAPDPTRHDA